MALGQVERDDDRPAAALPHYQQAVTLCRSAGLALPLAHALRHQGDLFTSLDRLGEAEAPYLEALAIYRDADDVAPLTLANALRPLALLHDQLGRADAAEPLWQEARGLYEEAGVTAGVEECRARLARRPA